MIEDVNSGVAVGNRRDSVSSHEGETGEFNYQGVSPGAPIDVETGTVQNYLFDSACEA